MNPISTLVPVQAVFTLTDNGLVITPDAIAWASDNTSVATVDANGLVTPVAAGDCAINGLATGNITNGTVTTPYSVPASGRVTVTQVGDNLVGSIDFQPVAAISSSKPAAKAA